MSKTSKAQALMDRIGAIKTSESVYTPPTEYGDIKAGLDKATAALGKLNAGEMPPEHQEMFKAAHGTMMECMDAAHDAHKKMDEIMGEMTTTGEHPPKEGPVSAQDKRTYDDKAD
jgi:hypothetical protein